jgi:hypothetical protein
MKRGLGFGLVLLVFFMFLFIASNVTGEDSTYIDPETSVMYRYSETTSEEKIENESIGEKEEEEDPKEPKKELKGEILILEYNFEKPRTEKVQIDNFEYDRVFFENGDEYGDPGEPVLPFRAVSVLLPEGATLNGVEVEGINEIEMEGEYFIRPGQEPFPLLEGVNVSVTMPGDSYFKDEPYFKEVGGEEIKGKVNGYNLVSFNIYPVNYVPPTKKLTYYEKISVKVYYSTPSLFERAREFFFPKKDNFRGILDDKERVEGLVDNPLTSETYNQKEASASDSGNLITGNVIINPAQKYDYLIITTQEFEDFRGENSFWDLIQRKEQKGMTGIVVSLEDIYSEYDGRDNPEKIRNFIRNAYLSWEVKYVLLGGDADGSDVGGESGDNLLPVRKLWVKTYQTNNWDLIPSDVYYSNLDGTFDYDNDNVFGERNDGEGGGEVDLYSEVYVGRAPVDSVDELQNFVRKTILYEDLYLSRDEYQDNLLMLGEHLGFGGVSEYATASMEEVKEGSSNYGYTTKGFSDYPYVFDSLYDAPGYSWPRSQLISRIENNILAINHLGHSSTCSVMKMSNYHIDALTNTKPVFVYSQGCYPGSFDNWRYSGGFQTCDSAGEHFVTGENGAFAVIMNSRYGWGAGYSTDGASQRHHRRFADAIVNESLVELGKANSYAKEGLIGYINSQSCSYWSNCLMRGIYWETNLLGDPELSFNVPGKVEHNLRVYDVYSEPRIYFGYPIEVGAKIQNNGLNSEFDVSVELYIDNVLEDSVILASVVEEEDVVLTYLPQKEGEVNLSVRVVPVLGEDFVADNSETIVRNVVATEIALPGDLNYYDQYNSDYRVLFSKHETLDIRGTALGNNFEGYALEWCDSIDGWDIDELSCQSNGMNIANESMVRDNLLGTFEIPDSVESGYYYIRLNNRYDSQDHYTNAKLYIESEAVEGWPKYVPPALTSGGRYILARQPTLADIDNDGINEILMAYGYYFYAYNSDGTSVSGFPVRRKSYGVLIHGPAVGDLDNDGNKEMVSVDSYGYVNIVHNNGTEMTGWPKRIGSGYGYLVSLEDISGDGNLEIIFGDGDGNVYVVNKDGNNLPGWPISSEGLPGFDYYNKVYTPISVGDLDNDGSNEIVVHFRACNNSPCYTENVGNSIVAFESDGEVKDGFPFNFYGSSIRSDLVLADLDNDNSLEILFSESTNLHILNKDGNEFLGSPFVVSSHIPLNVYGVSVADLDDNDYLDIIMGAYGYDYDNYKSSNCMYAYEFRDDELLLKQNFPMCSGDDFGNLSVSQSFSNVYFTMANIQGETNQIFASREGSTEHLGSVGSGRKKLPSMFSYDIDGSIANLFPKAVDGSLLTNVITVGDIDNDNDNEAIAYTWLGYLSIWDLDGKAKDNEWPVYAHDEMHTGVYSKPGAMKSKRFELSESLKLEEESYDYDVSSEQGNVSVFFEKDNEIYLSSLNTGGLVGEYDLEITNDLYETKDPSSVTVDSVNYVVYEDSRTGDNEIYFSRVDGSRVSEKRISYDSADSVDPLILSDYPNFMIMYIDTRDGSEIFFNKVDNFGNEIVSEKVVGSDAVKFDAIFNDELYIAWEDSDSWVHLSKLDNEGELIVSEELFRGGVENIIIIDESNVGIVYVGSQGDLRMALVSNFSVSNDILISETGNNPDAIFSLDGIYVFYEDSFEGDSKIYYSSYDFTLGRLFERLEISDGVGQFSSPKVVYFEGDLSLFYLDSLGKMYYKTTTDLERVSPNLTRNEIMSLESYSILISVESNEYASIFVDLKENNISIMNYSNESLAKDHLIFFEGLSPATEYSYDVSLTDIVGNVGEYSADFENLDSSGFFTRTTSKVPEMPSNFYGRLETTDGDSVSGIEITAKWTDVDDKIYYSKTNSLTLQEATLLGNSAWVGYYLFNDNKIKAKSGTKIEVSCEDDLNDPDLFILSNPGGETLEISDPLLLSGELPEIDIFSPISRIYSSTELPIYLSFNSSKKVKSASFVLNSHKVYLSGTQSVVLNPKIGENELSVSVVDITNLENTKSLSFDIDDVSVPLVSVSDASYVSEGILLSANVYDDLSSLDEDCMVCVSSDFVCDDEWVVLEDQISPGSKAGKCVYMIDKSEYDDGNYSFNFKVTDSYDNLGVGTLKSFTIDMTPPAEVFNLTASPLLSRNEIDLNWGVAVESGFKEYRVYRGENFGSLIRVIYDRYQNNYLDLDVVSEGSYNYRVTVVDSYGNENDGVGVSATVYDTVAPVVSVSSPRRYKTYNDENVELTYTVNEESDCSYYLNGINNIISDSVVGSEGRNDIFVSCDDGLNVGVSSNVTFYVDRTPPNEIENLSASQVFGSLGVRVSWSYSNSYKYYVYRDTEPFSDVTGKSPESILYRNYYNDYSGLSSGETYYYAVVPVDYYGNFNYDFTTKSVLIKEITPPEITIVSPASEALYNSSNVVLEYESNENVSSCLLYLDSLYPRMINSGEVLTLNEGSHALSLSCVDLAGNLGYSNSVSFGVDFQVPGVVSNLSLELDEERNVRLAWNSVNYSDFKEYRVYRENEDFSSIAGKTPYKTVFLNSYLDLSLDEGRKYFYSVSCVDLFGNEETNVTTVSVNIGDTTPPGRIRNLRVNEIVQENSLSLSWDQSNEDDFDHYNIYRSNNSFSSISQEEGSFEVESFVGDGMIVQRRDNSVALLSNGNVLIVGGYWASAIFGRPWLKSSEFYVLSSISGEPGETQRGPNMYYKRRWSKAIGIDNGRALVVGGQADSISDKFPRAEIYDPNAPDDPFSFGAEGKGDFVFINDSCDSNIGRYDHALTKLSDGRILVSGGSDVSTGGRGNSAEIFDPETNCFSPAGDMNEARAGHSATLLEDGRVLIVGGGGGYSSEIYDVNTNSFSYLNAETSVFSPRRQAAVLLNDGRVLLAGGSYGYRAEIYDLETDSFVSVGNNLSVSRNGVDGYLMPDGKVMFPGGYHYDQEGDLVDLTSVEIYDVEQNLFSVSEVLLRKPRLYGDSVQLANKQVFFAGGDRVGSVGTEVYGLLMNVSVELIHSINDRIEFVFTDTDLESGANYYYAVTSVDLFGNEDPFVSSVGGRVYEPEPLLVSLSFPENNSYYNYAEISLGYSMNKNVVGCNYSLNGVSNSFDDDLIVAAEGMNSVSLSCVDYEGIIGESKTVMFYVDREAPVMVDDLVVKWSSVQGNVELNWSLYLGYDFSNYNIYRSEQNFTSVEDMVAFAKKTSNTFVDNSVEIGEYYYAVTSVDKALNENDNVKSVFVEIVENDTFSPVVLVNSIGDSVYGSVLLSATLNDDFGLSESCLVCIASDFVCDTEWVSANNMFNEGDLNGSCSFLWNTSLYEKINYTYNFKVDDFSGNEGVGIQRQAVVVSPPPLSCSDGTFYGECSALKPKLCLDGSLVDSCSICGCNEGLICSENDSCELPPVCSDGTLYDECSILKPKLCLNGSLVDSCSTCGCDEGLICSENDSCELPPVCSDGTSYGECSVLKPKLCLNGSLVDNCAVCGCGAGLYCSLSGTCEVIVENLTCSDGTLYGECSALKPKLCLNGNLVNYCSICGCGVDFVCDDLTNVCVSPPLPSINISLYSGWNSFSVPTGLDDYSVESVLFDISGQYNNVYSFDSVSGNWLVFKENKTLFDSSNSLFSFESGKGYWIEMTDDAILTFEVDSAQSHSQDLKSGWNYLGYPYLGSKNIDDSFSNIGDKYDLIYSFNNRDKVWELYSPFPSSLFENSLSEMNTGKGYWIYVYEDVRWII